MRKYPIFAALAALFLSHGALAQGSVVVAACPSAAAIYAPGQTNRVPAIDIYGNVCQGAQPQGAAAAITAGWPVTDGAGTDTIGSITSGAGSVVALIDGYASAKIQVKGTYAAFTATISASSDGGITTVPLQCAMVDGTQFGNSFTLAANASVEISCGHQSGDDALIISTAAGPATGTANVTISPASFPSIDGSTILSVLSPIGADPCQNSNVAKSSVAINITSAATTQLVAISGTKSIYVCHFDMTISEVITTPNTLQFEYGTSTTCVGANKLTGLYGDKGITAGAPIVVSAGYGGTIFAVPSANGLCALTAIGAAGSFQGILTYVQQ